MRRLAAFAKASAAEHPCGPGVALAEPGPGHPGRRGSSVQTQLSLEYWIARSSPGDDARYVMGGACALRAKPILPRRQRTGKRQRRRAVDAARDRARDHVGGDRAEFGE